METSFNVTIDLDICEFAEYVNNNLDIISSNTDNIYAYIDSDMLKKYNTFDVIQINGKVPKKFNTFGIIGFLYDCIFASKKMMHSDYNAKCKYIVELGHDDKLYITNVSRKKRLPKSINERMLEEERHHKWEEGEE